MTVQERMIEIRRELVLDFLGNAGPLSTEAMDKALSFLDRVARWIETGVLAGNAVSAGPAPANPPRRKEPSRSAWVGATQPSRMHDYLEHLLNAGQPMPDNRTLAEASGIPVTDSKGSAASKILRKVLDRAGWELECRGTTANGTYQRRVVARDGRATLWSVPTGISQAIDAAAQPRALAEMVLATTTPTPKEGEVDADRLMAPEAELPAAAPVDAQAVDVLEAPITIIGADLSADALQIQSAVITDPQPDTPPSYDRTKVDPAGNRQVDHLAAIIFDLIKEAAPLPTNEGLLQRLKARFNGAWLMANVDTVGGALSRLQALGFCTVTRMDVPRVGNGPIARRLTLWDGRQLLSAPPPAQLPVTPPPVAPPNRNTNLFERRPSPAAKKPSDRDVSPDLRAQIEARVAAGQVTRAERPVHAVASESAQVHPKGSW